MASVAAVESVGGSPSWSRSRFPQAGLAVTVLNSQRTAYAKLADDREVILKTLQELKSGAAAVCAHRPTSTSHWHFILTVCSRRRGACVRACCVAVCSASARPVSRCCCVAVLMWWCHGAGVPSRTGLVRPTRELSQRCNGYWELRKPTCSSALKTWRNVWRL